MPTDLSHHETVLVGAKPEQVYDLVTDIARTGEWSPVCRACWWVEGDGPRVGAWFRGRNETPDRTWETQSLVVAAERGREFAWTVGGSWVRWGYTMRAVDGGTELTESWHFLPAGIAMFHERYGDKAEDAIASRTDAALTGIPDTLAAIRTIAERR